jgi:type I restriction enzyme R subunit
MTTQSEADLENTLIKQLVNQGYELATQVRDEATMVANLRKQLEKLNDTHFSDGEFGRILNHLSRGGVFDRAKTLRERMSLLRDDGTHRNVKFLNVREACKNLFQVTHQISQEGEYKNRYDVTILVNGLPLVQIELKRRGIELKEAFNQVNRYRRHSFASGLGLFQYVQILVISNGMNTKYYSNTVGYNNTKKEPFKFTSFWTDEQNNKLSKLDDFARVFLEKCHVAKMIAKYTVLTTDKTLLVLRPYQFYAAEAIVNKVANANPTERGAQSGGYIWHTTGSGKTLTSFKTAQLLMENDKVDKILFVVDRNDLDNQTIKEFNNFKEGSVDATTNTRNLVRQFDDPDTKLIVTTIQKLNTAITRERHAAKMDALRNKRIIFIFDECHRSQFGQVHKNITDYFTNTQMFGFTGTPILDKNAIMKMGFGKRTTHDLFGDCLHQYVITDAIRDENVLKFSVEYYDTFRLKDGQAVEDAQVEDINRQEVYEDNRRMDQVVDFILRNHARKTHSRDFTAIFAVDSVASLIRYYDLFKAHKHDLRVATIFTYGVNEEDSSADGILDENSSDFAPTKIDEHSRDALERFIGDYNKTFGTNYTTRDSTSFYNYYRNIADRVRAREVDILLVVNMFLTGFDSKTLNTLYVDKNLRYHGLLQAYSRTNRILNETKSQGNIICFRNLKTATDEALELFANKNARETVFVEPYDYYVKLFNEKLAKLCDLTPRPEDVDLLANEEQELAFVQLFRELLRMRNVLISFTDFTWEDLNISEQTMGDFQSKYLDLYEKTKTDSAKEKVSILDDIDFEVELTRRDEINVTYILRLIGQMVGANAAKQKEIERAIWNAMDNDVTLRSKRELIEKFIRGRVPLMTDPSEVETNFAEFWNEEQQKAFDELCKTEKLNHERTENIIGDYIYTSRLPREHALASALQSQPSILQRKSILKQIKTKIEQFIVTFIDE